MPPPVFRFAPSPNGYLHLGHAYSALLNFDLARKSGGRFLLRIEDIDAARCRPEYEAAIVGAGRLAWNEQGAGPAGETGEVPTRPEAWGDVILARKETPTSYHLSVAIDDARQGVTYVVRGEDLFWSTSVHRLLQQLL